ncbi:MAG: InlB B-repeat-containing protein [Tannerella sp.]|jgi:hypothetical protein|nr:InlB B-repeat-containing protein [Tannerella sp.]
MKKIFNVYILTAIMLVAGAGVSRACELCGHSEVFIPITTELAQTDPYIAVSDATHIATTPVINLIPDTTDSSDRIVAQTKQKGKDNYVELRDGGMLPADRLKDILINADEDMIAALGTPQTITQALHEYLTNSPTDTPAGLGIPENQVRIRNGVVTVDIVNMNDSWIVYDHYNHNYWENTSNFSQYGGATNLADAWHFLYGSKAFAGTFPTTAPYITSGNYWSPSTIVPVNNNMRPPFFVSGYTGSEGTVYSSDYLLKTVVAAGYAGLSVSHALREHIYVDVDPITQYPFLWFAGYNTIAATDWAFYPTTSTGTKDVKFSVNSANIIAHPEGAAGIMFNTGIDASGNIHGYYLELMNLWSPTTARYMLQTINGSAATLHNQLWNHANSNYNTAGTLLDQTVIPNFPNPGDNYPRWSNNVDVEVEITETTVKVWFERHDANRGVSVATKTGTPQISETLTPTGYQGFGFLQSWNSHSCGQGGAISFADLEMSFAEAGLVFQPILTGPNSQFDPGQTSDHFYVNLVNTSVNSAGPDYAPGIGDLRSDHTYYLSNNTDQTVVTTTNPAVTGDNCSNGLVGWPVYDASGAIVGTWGLNATTKALEKTVNGVTSAGTQADALKDYVKYIGDYIAGTTTDDWDLSCQSTSGYVLPSASYKLQGDDIQNGNSRAILQKVERQLLEDNPIDVLITDESSFPGVGVKQLKINWYFIPFGESRGVDHAVDSLLPTKQGLVEIEEQIYNVTSVGEVVHMTNFNLNGDDFVLASTSPAPAPTSVNCDDLLPGRYVMGVIAVGKDGSESAEVYRSFDLIADEFPAVAGVNLNNIGGTEKKNELLPVGTGTYSVPTIVLSGTTPYRGLSAEVFLSDDSISPDYAVPAISMPSTLSNVASWLTASGTVAGSGAKYNAWGADSVIIGFGDPGATLSPASVHWTTPIVHPVASVPVDGTVAYAASGDTIEWMTASKVDIDAALQLGAGKKISTPNFITDNPQKYGSFYVYVWDWLGNAALYEYPIAPYTVTYATDNVFNLPCTLSDITPASDPYANNYFGIGEVLGVPTPPSWTPPNYVDPATGISYPMTFAGYSTSPYSTVVIPATGFTVTGDMVLYPVFTSPGLFIEWDITYMVDDSGTPYATTEDVPSGTPANGLTGNGKYDNMSGSNSVPTATDIKPADPTKSGSRFLGWFTDKECTTEYKFKSSDLIIAGLTLYAGWTPPPTSDMFEIKPSEVLVNGLPREATVVVKDGAPGSGPVTIGGSTVPGVGEIIQIYYNGRTKIPTEPGEYVITIDISQGGNYAAITGLYVGIFTILERIPQPYERLVTITVGDDVIANVTTGVYFVESGENFEFEFTVAAGKEMPTLKTSPRTIPLPEGVDDYKITRKGDSNTYTVVIYEIRQNISVSIGDVSTTGTDEIAAPRIWGADGKLHITVPAAATAQVYTVTGVLKTVVQAPAGETTVALQPGLYIVRLLDGKTYKIVIK